MKYWVECTHRFARVMTGKISIVATIGVEDPTSKDSVKRAENAALEVANALEEEARQTEELRLNIEKSLLERERKWRDVLAMGDPMTRTLIGERWEMREKDGVVECFQESELEHARKVAKEYDFRLVKVTTYKIEKKGKKR